MPTSPSQLPDKPSLDYACLLAKHGYSEAGYAAAVQEAADSLVAHPLAAPPPSRDELAGAVETQLFHVVFT